MERLTQEEIEAIRKRAEAATPGPWYNTRWDVATKPDVTTGYPSSPESICGTFDGEYIENPNGTNDAEFIAHAREDVPKLLAEIERLRKLAQEILEDYDQSERGHIGMSANYYENKSSHEKYIENYVKLIGGKEKPE
jgi:hypothetical protein